MHQLNSISVLGCGWLGFPLSKVLVNNGYNVKGSTTSIHKLLDLSEAGIDPFLVRFPDSSGFENLAGFLKSQVLIIAVPPGRDDLKQVSYFGLLNSLTDILPESPVKEVIFISSTSVYGDVNRPVNEWDEPHPDTDAGKRMLRAEEIISKIPVRKSVVRLSGLFGPGRHPGRFLSGKTGVANGLAPVNLVHLDDVIGIILQILTNTLAEGVYNATAPHHPTREEFYSLACKSIGSDPPRFINEKRSWKEVQSVRVGEELNYTFKVPDPMHWLVNEKNL